MEKLRLWGVVVVAMAFVLVMSMGTMAESAKLVWTVKSEDPVKLSIWGAWAEEYMNTHPDVEVQLVVPTGRYEDTLTTWMAGGEGADIMWMGGAFFEFVDHLMPLNELFAKNKSVQEVLPHMIQTHTWEGNLLALPYAVNTHAVFYNKDLFAEAGLTVAKGWTWGDALNMARHLTKDNDGDGTIDQYGTSFYWDTHWLNYNDKPFYSSDGRTVNINNPLTTAAYQFWVDMKTGAHGIPNHTDRASLLSGISAMGNRGVFEVTVYRDAAFNWDVVELPWFEYQGKKYYSTFCSADTWTIWKGTKHPEEAKDFVSFLMSMEKNIEWGRLGAAIPTQPRVAAESFLKVDKPQNIGVFLNNLNYWNYGVNGHPAYSLIRPVLKTDTWVQMNNGSMPVRTGMPDIARMMNEALDEYWTSSK